MPAWLETTRTDRAGRAKKARMRILPQRGAIKGPRLRRNGEILESRSGDSFGRCDIQPPSARAFIADGLQLRVETGGLERGLAAFGPFAAAVAAQGDAIGLCAPIDHQVVVETRRADVLRQCLCGFAIRQWRQQHVVAAGLLARNFAWANARGLGRDAGGRGGGRGIVRERSDAEALRRCGGSSRGNNRYWCRL